MCSTGPENWVLVKSILGLLKSLKILDLYIGGARVDDSSKLVHTPLISLNGVPMAKVEQQPAEEQLVDGIASGLIDLGTG